MGLINALGTLIMLPFKIAIFLLVLPFKILSAILPPYGGGGGGSSGGGRKGRAK